MYTLISTICYILLHINGHAYQEGLYSSDPVPDRQEWYFDTNTISLGVTRLTKCAVQCREMTDCMSILYNTLTGECYGASVAYLFRPASVGYNSYGWTYYLSINGKIIL